MLLLFSSLSLISRLYANSLSHKGWSGIVLRRPRSLFPMRSKGDHCCQSTLSLLELWGSWCFHRATVSVSEWMCFSLAVISRWCSRGRGHCECLVRVDGLWTQRGGEILIGCRERLAVTVSRRTWKRQLAEIWSITVTDLCGWVWGGCSPT